MHTNPDYLVKLPRDNKWALDVPTEADRKPPDGLCGTTGSSALRNSS